MSSAAKQVASDLVVMAIFGLLALGIVALGDRIANKTRVLRDEGENVEVVVTRIERPADPIAHVRYRVGGAEYVTEARVAKPAPSAGALVIGRYHPSEPKRVRLRPLDEASIAEDIAPFRTLPWFFAAPLVMLVGARIARLRGKNPITAVAPLVGLLLLGIVVGVNFTDDVQATLVQRFGPTWLGLPSPLAVSAAEVVLLGPLLWGWATAALPLFQLAQTSGASLGRFGLIFWVVQSDAARAEPALRRRFIATAAALLAVLVLAIIALTLTDPPAG